MIIYYNIRKSLHNVLLFTRWWLPYKYCLHISSYPNGYYKCECEFVIILCLNCLTDNHNNLCKRCHGRRKGHGILFMSHVKGTTVALTFISYTICFFYSSGRWQTTWLETQVFHSPNWYTQIYRLSESTNLCTAIELGDRGIYLIQSRPLYIMMISCQWLCFSFSHFRITPRISNFQEACRCMSA